MEEGHEARPRDAQDIPFAAGESTARCMKRVARQRYVEGIAAEAQGIRIGLRASAPGVLEVLLDALPPGWTAVSSGEPVHALYSVISSEAPMPEHRLYAGPRLVQSSPSLAVVRRELEAYIDTVLAVSAPKRLWLHAGVVADGDRAIVLPGSSGAGKTTLVRALLDRGARYYSDDAAVLDARGRVHPYARPLAMRARGVPLARRRLAVPEASVGRDPLPVGLIVITRWREGARFRPAPMAGARSVLRLLEHALSARARPEATLRALGRLMARAAVFEGDRGDADRAAESILQLLRGLR